jgi:glycosyltransferase involved in cell wall biosynthesis
MPVKLALSTLCENPHRRTGLSTFFPEFIAHSRRLFPEVSWIVFAGGDASWPFDDPCVEICRKFPSNERPVRRLLADHLRVAREARRRGASALLTVGFHPVWPAGLPVVMHVFALGHPRQVGRVRAAYRQWAVNRGLKRARLVIANSSWTKGCLGPTRAPVLVSPEGLRHDLFRPEGARGAPGCDGGYFLWVSNLYAYKRFDLLLSAYSELPEQVRSKIPLVVVGGDWGGGRRRAEDAATHLGIRERVRFLGWVEDGALPELYRGATAHVLSTSQETFGRTVLEAMACGCPSVVQDLPVLREVAGECADYTDYADRRQAARALLRICSDAAHRGRLSAAGIERSKQFGFDRLARERVGAVLAGIRPPSP